jgi:cyclohexa-1,5-dienecarbonyl-CoA hydratase
MQEIRFEREHEGAVARITLAAPKGNVLDGAMMKEIVEAIDDASADAGVKLLIFDHDGDHFSFGASVEEHQPTQAPEMLRTFHRIFHRLADAAIPTMALVRGRCLGGGMELATYCHLVFARADAMFGQPEIVLGVLPPLASVILPLRCGQQAADCLCITGRTATAEEAREMGLVNRVFDSEEALRAGVEEFVAKHFLPKSASSLRFAVRAARHRFHRRVQEDLEQVEKLYLEELMETGDAVEGIASFLEKRKPVWKNA